MLDNDHNPGTAILVVGMHRSGTSAFTRTLNLLGVELGHELLHSERGNSLGHWEHRDALRCHERLLSRLGRTWDDLRPLPDGWLASRAVEQALEELRVFVERDFSDVPLWAMKDPRLCRLLPMWLKLLDDINVKSKVVLVIRDPAEVARSLYVRDGLSGASSRLLWLQHVVAAEAATRETTRAVVVYSHLLQDWQKTVTKLARDLRVEWPRQPDNVANEITAFLDPRERHHCAEGISDKTRDPASSLYHLLASDASPTEVPWDSIREWVAKYDYWAPSFLRPIEDLIEAVGELEQEQLAHQRDQQRDQQQLADVSEQLQTWRTLADTLQRGLSEREQQLQVRDDAITERDNAVARHGQKVEDLEAVLQEQSVRAAHVQHRVRALERSLSWRITAPLRGIADTVSHIVAAAGTATQAVCRLVRAVGHLLRHPHEYWQTARQLGLHYTFVEARAFLVQGGPKPAVTPPRDEPENRFDLRYTNGLPVVILTTPHCRFVAEGMARILERVGINTEIIFERPPNGYSDVPHFVISPQMFESLPGLYVAFQMEQSVSSRWFTKKYLHILENSFAVLDYSLRNISKLTELGLSHKQLFYVPIGPVANYRPVVAKRQHEYDVLFYGDANNERRRSFLSALQNKFHVRIINDLFGDELHEEIAKARVVINIHYYEGALLETTRMWECISLGKVVVSERGADMQEHEELAELVDWVDVGDVQAMAERIDYWLRNEDAFRTRESLVTSRPTSGRSGFDYYFLRFLLSSENISFDRFWQLTEDHFPDLGGKLCLSLPEYTRRGASFDQENVFGFVRFPGLRHRLGWIGCGMSYKYMAKLALRDGHSVVTICEDDVLFSEDFPKRWSVIEGVLDAGEIEWDLFSGLMADLHRDAVVRDAFVIDGEQFVVLDRLVSAVFNAYHGAVLRLLADWDDTLRDVHANAIDRYLENQTGLTVLTTVPFLAGHKEELDSTIWGFQNSQYTGMILASQMLLEQKVADARRDGSLQ